MVKSLVDARTLYEALVEVAHQLDGVGHIALAETTEQIADGDVGGAPQWFPRKACQVLVEEQRGTFVGEYHRRA